MYCNECKSFFDEPGVEYGWHSELGAEGPFFPEKTIVCPICRGDYIEDSDKCTCGGDKVEGDEFCESCKIALSKELETDVTNYAHRYGKSIDDMKNIIMDMLESWED